MANVTSALLQAKLLDLQSRRLALISLIMSPRLEEGAPSPPISGLSVLAHRVRILTAYVALRREISACRALQARASS